MSTFVAVRFWKLATTSALIALSIGLVGTTSAGATTLAFGVPQVFQETGAPVTTYQTPSNTCGLLVDALGGAGGSGYTGSDSLSSSDFGGSGGGGGSLSVVVPVSGAQTLSISVGHGGGNGTAGAAGSGGYGGGGAGGVSATGSAAAGGGGGESVVAILSGSTLAVAGGGGGGDDDWNASYDEASGGPGGVGANTSGSAGANATGGAFGGDYSSGQGGTLTGGGAGSVGVSGTNGAPGSANQGGAGATGTYGEVGGGGAGGYFGGGGGGERSGGGGGSTYAITGWSTSNTSSWTPNPTVATNGEISVTAEECQSINISAAPSSSPYGANYTPTASATSGLSVALTIDPSATSICSVSAGVVTMNAIGNCVIDATQTGNASWAPATEVTQTIPVVQATPTTPNVTNLPGSAVVGGSFTPTVSTNGDGVKSVSGNSPSVCTISAGVVSYLAVGTCSLTAHIANGTNYTSADGTAQTFSVGQGTPTSPTITNLPGSAVVGGSFTPTVSTNGDGVTSVTSNSLSVCTSSAGTVTFIAAGTCSLTAQLANGTNYIAATGTAQTVVVGSATHLNIITFNSEGGTTVAPVEASNGQSITLPVAPQRTEYSFVGWFATATGGAALTSPYVVSGSTTLYAQWTQTSQSTPSTPPTAPVIVGHSQSTGTITVTITRLPGNGGSVVLEYLALLHGKWQSVIVNAHHQFTIHGLRPHHRYNIRLRARNSVGLGTPSRSITVTVV